MESEQQHVDRVVAAIASRLVGNHTVCTNEYDIRSVLGPTTNDGIKDVHGGPDELLPTLVAMGPRLTKLKNAKYPPLDAELHLDGKRVGTAHFNTPYGLHQTCKAFATLRLLCTETTTRAELDARKSKVAGDRVDVPRILDKVDKEMPVVFNAPVVWRLVNALMKLQTHIWEAGGTDTPEFATIDGLRAYRQVYTVLVDPAAAGTWTSAKTTRTGKQTAEAMLETPEFKRVFAAVTTQEVERVFGPLLDDPIKGHGLLKGAMRDTTESVAALMYRVAQCSTDIALRARISSLLTGFRACGINPETKDAAPLGPFAVIEHQTFLAKQT
jgi:hypothetical protein